MTSETSSTVPFMINKYFDGQIPAYVEGVTDFDNELAQVAEQSIANYHTYMEAVDYPRALEAVWDSYLTY